MNAKELIGRKALRTEPILEKRMDSSLSLFPANNTFENYFYCTEPVKIINATENHIAVERKGIGDKFITILDKRYCDNNWVDYDDLVNNKNTSEIIKKQLEIGKIFIK